MRITLAAAAILSLTSFALAAPVEKNDRASERPNAGPHGASVGAPARPLRPAPHSHDPFEESWAWRHHYGVNGGILFYPYPSYPLTWPYPPYPFTYPYPYAYYDDRDDNSDSHSTRGLVVPGAPVAGPAYWYYCDTPDGYYPYVKSCSHVWTPIPIAPPPPGAATPVSYSDWQWCEETKSFFPYVSSCRAGFVSIPVTAPGADNAGPPSVTNWFFCADPKGYAPYVVQCKNDWRAVPAVPPPSVKITVKSEPAAKQEKAK